MALLVDQGAGLTMITESIATAAVRASTRPSSVAPVFIVMA